MKLVKVLYFSGLPVRFNQALLLSSLQLICIKFYLNDVKITRHTKWVVIEFF